MMEPREIKFNAWDRATKRWIAEGFHVIGEVTCFNIIAQELMKAPLGKTTLERMGDVEIVQFTGKKDKNDKDIYEGDIVSVYGELRLVEFKNAFWHLELKEGDVLGGFGTETQAGHKPIYRYPKDWIEVVGNIFQNPDLVT